MCNIYKVLLQFNMLLYFYKRNTFVFYIKTYQCYPWDAHVQASSLTLSVSLVSFLLSSVSMVLSLSYLSFNVPTASSISLCLCQCKDKHYHLYTDNKRASCQRLAQLQFGGTFRERCLWFRMLRRGYQVVQDPRMDSEAHCRETECLHGGCNLGFNLCCMYTGLQLWIYRLCSSNQTFQHSPSKHGHRKGLETGKQALNTALRYVQEHFTLPSSIHC